MAPDKTLIPHIADPLAIHRYIRFLWIWRTLACCLLFFCSRPLHPCLVATAQNPPRLQGEFGSPPSLLPILLSLLISFFLSTTPSPYLSFTLDGFHCSLSLLLCLDAVFLSSPLPHPRISSQFLSPQLSSAICHLSVQCSPSPERCHGVIGYSLSEPRGTAPARTHSTAQTAVAGQAPEFLQADTNDFELFYFFCLFFFQYSSPPLNT